MNTVLRKRTMLKYFPYVCVYHNYVRCLMIARSTVSANPLSFKILLTKVLIELCSDAS